MIHKHHIVPRYKCKELGIDPDFDDNFADMTRHQHALIHWGYWCKDLSPLLEVCNPPQYVLDMIPLGDKRDISSAIIIARGEIDGIDQSGENHWTYGLKPGEHPCAGIPRTHGRAVGALYDKTIRKSNDKWRNAEYHKNHKEKERARMRFYHHHNKGNTQRAQECYEEYRSLGGGMMIQDYESKEYGTLEPFI